MTKIGAFLLFVSAMLLSAFGQDMASLKAAFKKANQKADLDYALGLNQLTPKYVGALTKYQDQAKDKGDLDGLIAFREEADRVAGGLSKVSQYSKVPELARMQKMLNEKINTLEKTRSMRRKATIQTMLTALSKAQVRLTQAGDIDGAVAAKNMAEELRNGADLAHLSRVEGVTPQGGNKWTVIFRSSHISGWGENLNSAGQYSLAKDEAPQTIRFLRIANITNNDYVIFPLTRNEIYDRPFVRKGNFYWTSFRHDGRTLGICDRSAKNPSVRVGPYNYGGWGFGRDFSGSPKVAWDRQSGNDAVLEFAVCNADLTQAEAAKLLVPENSTGATVARTTYVPPKSEGAIELSLDKMVPLGEASLSGTSLKMFKGSQATWDLSSLPPALYRVVITSRKKGRDAVSLTAQGSRETSRNKTKIVLERGNHVLRGVPDEKKATAVDFGQVRLGGFNRLQLICNTNGETDYAMIYRVELVR